jgi:hypothetical protein
MMLESIATFVKTLPHWLAITVEVLVVAVIFMTALTFLAGVWCGLRIIGRRANEIEAIELWPPRIKFKE